MTEQQVTIRIILADDHELVRSGIRALVTEMRGMDVIAEAARGDELVGLAESLRPDIVLTDIAMPGLNGLEAIAQLRTSVPDVRAIVLSMYDTVDVVKRAVTAGACGYLMKDTPQGELEQAIRTVYARGSYFAPSIASALLLPSSATDLGRLTERQLEIMKLLASGKTSKEIAYDLGLSSKTVDVHRARIMERLQVSDLASLTRLAIRNGLVQL